MISIDEIKSFFEGEILVNEPMSNHTSIRVGGPADLFLIPKNKVDAVSLIQYLNQKEKRFIVIGNGSNILVSDEGVRETIISLFPNLNQLDIEKNIIYVEAGVMLARFVDFCIQNSKKGVEKLAGIPGTIGGALAMNAGAYNTQISDFLLSVEFVQGSEVLKVKKENIEFRYRWSSLYDKVILSAEFSLPDGDIKELQTTRSEYLLKRNKSQPLNFPNSGSIFKNPPDNYAAKLIESAGLKGKRIGNAMISEKHGNFIVNLGNASAKDIIELINFARREVYQKFKIILEPEIKLIGFKKQILENV